MDLVAQLTHEQGTATVLVTHDLVHRAALDRLVTVVDGRITDIDASGLGLRVPQEWPSTSPA